MLKFCLRLSCFRDYAFSAPAKSGVGIGVPDMQKAITDAPASFLLSRPGHIQIMVGWAGASHEAPVSFCAGYANPAQFTTSEIGVSCGENISQQKEDANMATIPTQIYPNLSSISAMEVHHA